MPFGLLNQQDHSTKFHCKIEEKKQHFSYSKLTARHREIIQILRLDCIPKAEALEIAAAGLFTGRLSFNTDINTCEY